MMTIADTSRGGHPFDDDTAVRPLGTDRFAATLSDRFDRLGGGPLGGYSVAVALRALGAAMPFPDPIVVSAFFVGRARSGPVDIRTELVRSGRSSATGESRLLHAGSEVLRLLATYADLDAASGPTSVHGTPPSLPEPDACVDPLDGLGLPGVSITDRVEYRFATAPGWSRGTPSGEPWTECWIRFKEPRDADVLAVPLLVDAVAPMVLELGALGSSTLELTVHVRARPTPGWLACRIATRHVVDGYHEEDFELWDGDGRLVAQSRQLARLPAGPLGGNPERRPEPASVPSQPSDPNP